jgi:DNA helicase-2/ATP-dependent DNA helicase PcrA
MEEERRLCYVGITRAKQRVYLVRAFRRSSMGGTSVNLPSRFLSDVPPQLVAIPRRVTEEAQSQSVAVPSSASSVRKPPLSDGDHVLHAKFGEGVVVSCVASGDDQEVTVAFKGGVGIKRLLLSLAPLEKVQ